MKRLMTLVLASGICLLSAASFADPPPPQNVSSSTHGNLARAQQAIDEAYRALNEAQQANKSDLGGHITNAKTLLQQADAEIKQAAETANALKKQNHH
jgi:septal ring factor EnvC (AmiA/AmiB activator)